MGASARARSRDVRDDRLPGPGVGTDLPQAVQADERDPGGEPRTWWRKSAGRPEITATRAKRSARRASSAGTPGHGRAPTGSAHDGRQGAVEVEAERAVAGILGEGEKDLGEGTHRGRRV